MGFSFNPSLLFECRSCKHLFPTSDKLKEHKLANHLGECLRIKCIIFKETFLDFSFSTEEPKTDSLPQQNSPRNQHQLSRPLSEFRNPYVSLERLNLLEVNGKSRKRQAAQSNHSDGHPVLKQRKQYCSCESTNDTEEAIIAPVIPNKVVEDQTEVPTLTKTSIFEATFPSSNENQPENHLQTVQSPSNENQTESTLVLGNVEFIVASIETGADGTEMVRLECFNREVENLDQPKDLDDFSEIKVDVEDNGPDLELELHSPNNRNEEEQVFTTAPNSPDYEPESSDESVEMSDSSNVKSEDETNEATQVCPISENKMIKCSECPSTFKHRTTRTTHMIRVHGKETKFKCRICNKFFAKRRDLGDHERRVHTKDCPFKCDVTGCSKSFPSKANLFSHMIVHKPTDTEAQMMKCPDCSSTFKYKTTLTSHMIMVHGKESKYKCGICAKYFATRRNVDDHERRVHTKECPFKCDVPNCSKSFPSRNELCSHRKTLHNPAVAEEMVKCSQCPATFKHKTTRASHMVLVHGKQTNFKCKICGKCFTQRRRVEDHERRHTKDFPFKCDAPDCSRSFPSKTSLHSHQKAIHNPGGPEAGRIKCSQCPSTFKYESTRAFHMVTVHGKETNFKCRICGKCFTQTRRWKEHERRHLKDRPFKCDVPDCSKSFSGKSDLWSHQRKIHSVELGLATFLCATCGKTFGLQSLLNRHVQIHHENSRPFKCTFDDSCSRAFSCKRALTEHERLRHTFEKPYQCDKCGKSYAAKDTFSRHVRRHEGPVRRKGYSCTFCPRKFQFKGSFVAHIKSHESGRMFNCSYCEFQFGTKRMLITHEKSHKEKVAVDEDELSSE